MKAIEEKPKPNLKARSGYEVGYAKPPESSRFKPGRSGNPGGRPKGAKNKKPGRHEEALKEIIRQEAYRNIEVRDGDRNISMPIAQAVMRSLTVSAAKGQIRAQRLFTDLVGLVEKADRERHVQWLESAITYKVEAEREIELCKEAGLPAPKYHPHPDQIKIDFSTDEVHIVGPITKEDKEIYDRARLIESNAYEEIDCAQKELETETDPDIREMYEEDIARSRSLIKIADGKLEW